MPKLIWESVVKESEIGEIPDKWETKKIDDVCSLQYGITASSQMMGTCRLLRMADIQEDGITPESIPYAELSEDDIEKYKLREADIVISRIANIGTIGIVKKRLLEELDKPLVFGSYLLRFVRFKENIDRLFFYYWLKSPFFYEHLLSVAEGSTRLNTNAKVIGNSPVVVPPLSEQSRIATLLSGFDDSIENKKKQNEILEKTAMAIFKSWFIDFEPFKDVEFVDSELGKIPENWTAKPIGKVAELRNGMSYSGEEKFEEYVEGSHVFITLNNAIEGGGFKPAYAWIKSNRIKEHHFLEEGDLIIPNTEQTKDERLLGSPGIVFFPNEYEQKKGVYSHHITKISPNDQKYKLLLYLFLRFSREDSASFHTGTGVLGLDINNFRQNKTVICPSEPVLERFCSLVEPLFQKIILNQKQIMTLKKVRGAILPLLVFGKLRVEEI